MRKLFINCAFVRKYHGPAMVLMCAGIAPAEAQDLAAAPDRNDVSAQVIAAYRARMKVGPPTCLSVNARPYAHNQTIVCAPRAKHIARLPLPSERFADGEVVNRPWEVRAAPVRGRVVGSCTTKRGRTCAGMISLYGGKPPPFVAGLHNFVAPKVPEPPQPEEAPSR